MIVSSSGITSDDWQNTSLWIDRSLRRSYPVPARLMSRPSSIRQASAPRNFLLPCLPRTLGCDSRHSGYYLYSPCAVLQCSECSSVHICGSRCHENRPPNVGTTAIRRTKRGHSTNIRVFASFWFLPVLARTCESKVSGRDWD